MANTVQIGKLHDKWITIVTLPAYGMTNQRKAHVNRVVAENFVSALFKNANEEYSLQEVEFQRDSKVFDPEELANEELSSTETPRANGVSDVPESSVSKDDVYTNEDWNKENQPSDFEFKQDPEINEKLAKSLAEVAPESLVSSVEDAIQTESAKPPIDDVIAEILGQNSEISHAQVNDGPGVLLVPESFSDQDIEELLEILEGAESWNNNAPSVMRTDNELESKEGWDRLTEAIKSTENSPIPIQADQETLDGIELVELLQDAEFDEAARQFIITQTYTDLSSTKDLVGRSVTFTVEPQSDTDIQMIEWSIIKPEDSLTMNYPNPDSMSTVYYGSIDSDGEIDWETRGMVVKASIQYEDIETNEVKTTEVFSGHLCGDKSHSSCVSEVLATLNCPEPQPVTAEMTDALDSVGYWGDPEYAGGPLPVSPGEIILDSSLTASADEVGKEVQTRQVSYIPRFSDDKIGLEVTQICCPMKLFRKVDGGKKLSRTISEPDTFMYKGSEGKFWFEPIEDCSPPGDSD